MIRFNFNVSNFEELNEEEYMQKGDKNYSNFSHASCMTYYNLFEDAGIPVVNPEYSGDEFQFGIEENIDEAMAKKIGKLIKDMGFEILYDSEDNYFRIRDRGQPEWNDVLMIEYTNEEMKNGFEFAEDRIDDVVTGLLICCDDVNNAVRLVTNL